MIKTVVFDIGRVLIGFEWQDYVKTLFDENTAEKVTAATFGGPYWKELDRGIMTTDEIFSSMRQIYPGHEFDINKALDHVGECTTRTEYAIPWIKSLKEEGYTVLYLSNFSEYVREKGGHTLDFVQYMDGGIFSHNEKCIKPGKEIYNILFRKYNIRPEESVFIDDSAANIETAISLGMRGIVFRSYEQAHEELQRIIEEEKEM